MKEQKAGRNFIKSFAWNGNLIGITHESEVIDDWSIDVRNDDTTPPIDPNDSNDNSTSVIPADDYSATNPAYTWSSPAVIIVIVITSIILLVLFVICGYVCRRKRNGGGGSDPV